MMKQLSARHAAGVARARAESDDHSISVHRQLSDSGRSGGEASSTSRSATKESVGRQELTQSADSGHWAKLLWKELRDLQDQVQELGAAQRRSQVSVRSIEACTESTFSLVSKLYTDLGKAGAVATAPHVQCPVAPLSPKTPPPVVKIDNEVTYLEYARGSEGMRSPTMEIDEQQPRSPDRKTYILQRFSSASSASTVKGRSGTWQFDRDSFSADAMAHGMELRDLPPQWPACIELRKDLLEDHHDQPNVTRHFSTLATRRTLSLYDSGSMAEEHPWGKGFDPDSRLMAAFDWFALLVLMHDVLVTPYTLAWDVRIEASLAGLAASSALFWTVRMVMAFSMGFYQRGELILDRKRITLRYLRSTFALDFIIVIADWLVILLDTVSVLRFTALLRLAKVIRLANAMAMLEKLLEAIIPRSRLLMRICQVTCSMLCFTHLMCCIWYALGRSALSDTSRSWLDDIDDIPAYPYLTAFHWTLAQVTLGATEITPVNSWERIFGIILLVFGTLFSATIIAFISSETMEYVSTRRENLEMMTQLKHYLWQNHVYDQLKSRVQKQVSDRLWNADQPLSEEDVPAIKLLSTTLRADLKRETRTPHMLTHPLFATWKKVDLSAIRRLCDEAVTFAVYKAQDNVFVPGEYVDCCCHLVTGKLVYQQEPETSWERHSVSTDVLEGAWICEAGLWTSWVTVGTLDAVIGCKTVVVSAEGTAKVLKKHPLIRILTRSYAQAYHLRVQSARPPYSKWPTDILVPDTQPSDLLSNDLGLELLRQAEKRGALTEAAYSDLVTEVKEEKCSIQESPTGRLERVVPVVALKIIRPFDGRILVEVGVLAKDNKKGLKITCILPGKKRLKGELVHRTVQRILETELSPYAKGVEASGQDTEMEARESASYGIFTKYLRTIQNLQLKHSFQEPTLVPVRMKDRDSTKNSRTSFSAGTAAVAGVVSTLGQVRDPFVDDAVAESILPLEDETRVRLYSWMKPATLDYLSSDVGKHFLSAWVGRVDTKSLEGAKLDDSFKLGDRSVELATVAEDDPHEPEGSSSALRQEAQIPLTTSSKLAASAPQAGRPTLDFLEKEHSIPEGYVFEV